MVGRQTTVNSAAVAIRPARDDSQVKELVFISVGLLKIQTRELTCGITSQKTLSAARACRLAIR
jgi:hypothetical protein